MTKLVWDELVDRRYERGVDRGVLYLDNGTVAIPWNGLTDVEERFGEDYAESYFIDGAKYIDIKESGDFIGAIKAYTYPDEFEECQGLISLETGLLVDNQIAKPFSLCFRTHVGNAEDGTDYGYKIHILYNLTALPDPPDRVSQNDSSEIVQFSWGVFSRAEFVPDYRPTTHVIIDSTQINPEMLADLEHILYGDDDETPALPSMEELVAYAQGWMGMVITDNGDGTWTATGMSSELIIVDGVFFILEVEPVYSDEDTFTLTVTG